MSFVATADYVFVSVASGVEVHAASEASVDSEKGVAQLHGRPIATFTGTDLLALLRASFKAPSQFYASRVEAAGTGNVVENNTLASGPVIPELTS